MLPEDCSPCLSECESVFDRVVVSNLIRGGTRVMWELLPDFTDPNPLVFQLQVGQTSNPNADDWENVGLPVTNQYYAIDSEQRVWGKTNWTHYRVVVTSSLRTAYSLPVNGLGILNRRDWRIARDIVRQRRLLYRKGSGSNAQEGFLLKRRWTGLKCPDCLDYQTDETRNPDCTTCYGTGFQCGYFYPIGCVYASLGLRSDHTQLVDQRNTVNDVVIHSEMLMTELLSEEDVWVNRKTDNRYYIHTVTHKAEVRGVPLVADVEMRLIPYSSVIYTIAIPDQIPED